MAIINKRLPIQIFFQSKVVTFRKIDKAFVIEYNALIYAMTWAQAVTLMSFLHDNMNVKQKEKLIKDFSIHLPKGKWIWRNKKHIIAKITKS